MMNMPTFMETMAWDGMFVFVMGLIWGSFFNVCITRIPFGKSVVFSPSSCPKCNSRIRWYMNVPVISFLVLRARCAYCHEKISLQYPLVELITAILFVALYYRFGWGVLFVSHAVFVSVLLIVSVIDLYHRIIPDELSLPGIVVGFVISCVLGFWKDSLIGLLVGGGAFFLIAYLYEKLAKREGLGGGDVKLLAMIGAWLGYQSILPVILLSSLAGSVVGIGYMVFAKKDLKTAIPFGPFLAGAAVCYVFFGSFIIDLLFWSASGENY